MSEPQGGSPKRDDALVERIARLHERDPHPELSGARRRLHLALHLVVERQLEDPNLPEARAALRRLVAEGLSPHEARHAIGTVVVEETMGVLGDGRPYDDARYRARLRELSAEAYRREAQAASGEEEGDQGK